MHGFNEQALMCSQLCHMIVLRKWLLSVGNAMSLQFLLTMIWKST